MAELTCDGADGCCRLPIGRSRRRKAHPVTELSFTSGRITSTVPRFFFHVYDDTVALDEEGQDLPSSAAAKEEAIKAARQLACAEVMKGHLGLAHRIEVEDKDGVPVATVAFKDAIQLHP